MWFVNFMRFTVFTVGGLAIRRSWNWLVSDIEPFPGSKEFNRELLDAEKRYKHLKHKKEEYDETIRKVR